MWPFVVRRRLKKIFSQMVLRGDNHKNDSWGSGNREWFIVLEIFHFAAPYSLSSTNLAATFPLYINFAWRVTPSKKPRHFLCIINTCLQIRVYGGRHKVTSKYVSFPCENDFVINALRKCGVEQWRNIVSTCFT